MPHEVTWNRTDDIVLCRLHGAVDGPGICDAIDQTARVAHAHGETVDVCVDWRAIQMLVVSPPDVTEIIRRVHRFAVRHPNGRTAIIATRTMHRVAARMLVAKSYLHGRDRQVFATMEEALEWVSASFSSCT